MSQRARGSRRIVPMWTHQLTEYVLAAFVLMVAVRRHSAMRWTLSGAAVALALLSAATDAPLGAWRALDRRLHLLLDGLFVAGLATMIVVVGGGRDGASIATALGAAVIVGWLAATTKWKTRPRRTTGDRHAGPLSD